MNSDITEILIASANIQLQKQIVRFLDNEGLKTSTATDGVEALYMIDKNPTSVIILDEELPKISGLKLATLLKQSPELKQLPVIVLHAANSKITKNDQAYDFLEKPINASLLTTRLKLLLKKPERNRAHHQHSYRPANTQILNVDRDTYTVHYLGKEILLPRKEFELLHLLASRPDKVFTREEIFRSIWRKEITPKAGRTIDVHIRKLRSKIAEDLIITVKGIGYRIVM